MSCMEASLVMSRIQIRSLSGLPSSLYVLVPVVCIFRCSVFKRSRKDLPFLWSCSVASASMRASKVENFSRIFRRKNDSYCDCEKLRGIFRWKILVSVIPEYLVEIFRKFSLFEMRLHSYEISFEIIAVYILQISLF